jgi:hypothetical protein
MDETSLHGFAVHKTVCIYYLIYNTEMVCNSSESLTSPVGLGTKNHCAGESNSSSAISQSLCNDI